MIHENFSRSEFACKCGCGFNAVDKELLDILVDLRYEYKESVTITSGCRCQDYNFIIKGSKGSKHCKGLAADIVVNNVDPLDVSLYLRTKYKGLYGIGTAKDFTHIDVRGWEARWTY